MQTCKRNNYMILECFTSSIEMYQLKTFYYQKVNGIRDFRYSMSQDKSYLYFSTVTVDGITELTLSEFLNGNYSKTDIYQLIEQIQVILMDSSNYLLYASNFYLNPNWINLKKIDNELKVELLYVPFHKGSNINYNENCECFIKSITEALLKLGDVINNNYFSFLELT